MADKIVDIEVKHDGLVAEICNERKVVLNKGSNDGISNGDKFVVFNLGEEVHDPKTGESLGILEEIKGKGKVIHVQDHMCTIQTYEFEIEPMPPSTPITRRDPSPILYQGEKRKVFRKFVEVERGDYVRKIRF